MRSQRNLSLSFVLELTRCCHLVTAVILKKDRNVSYCETEAAAAVRVTWK